MPGIEPIGLATHIGSQILGLAPYRDAFARIADLVRALRQRGLRVETVDCGGGLGIPYRNESAPSPAGLAAAIKEAFHNLDVRLAMEPGRWLVGPAGVLLASVVLVKQTPHEPFVVLDAAMNDLVRPAMYDAWHGIVPVSPTDAVAPARPCYGRRPGLRKQRHVRAKPLASVLGTQRACSDSRCRRVWCGHELNLQRSPTGSRGLGGRRTLVGDPRTANRSRRCGSGSGSRMTDPAPPLRRLAARRLLARAAILFEALWPALWPPLAVVGVFLCLALLNLLPLLPGWLHVGLLAFGLVAVIGLLVQGVRDIRFPNDRAADRRLETRSGLIHRPLSVLTDRPAIEDSLGDAIWQAHAARALAQIGRLKVGFPRPGLARLDPRALRYGLLLGVVACLGIANTDATSRLYAAVTPSLPVSPGAPATELQAWITPPGLYANCANLPEGRWQQHLGPRRLASDGERLRWQRRADAVVERPLGSIYRIG